MQPQNFDSIPYHAAEKHPNETISRGLYQIADEVYVNTHRILTIFSASMQP
jgi:hypothetical protein